MKFTCYHDKIEIKPNKKEGIILSQEEGFVESGEVLQVGSAVEWIKKGDTIFFESWGCTKTPEVDGVTHYLVSYKPDVILGKYEGGK